MNNSLLDTKFLALQMQYFDKYDNIPNKFLYHYTKAKNLYLILQENNYSFRMTRASDFVDKGEGKLIIDLYKKVIKQLINNKKIDDITYQNIVDVEPLDAILVNDDYTYLSKYESYVLCFCEKNSDNYMWDEYGDKKTGICIYVPTYLFHASFLKVNKCQKTNHMPCFDYSIVKIVYDAKEQLNILYNRILEIINIFNSEIKNENAWGSLKFIIAWTLKELRLMFKLDKYKDENEIRLIFQLAISNIDYEKCVCENEDGKRFVTLEINKQEQYIINKGANFKSEIKIPSNVAIE